MTEKNNGHSTEAEASKPSERRRQLPKDALRGDDKEMKKGEHWKIAADGQLRVPYIGDLNDMDNSDAWTTDETGEIKAKRWVVAVWDEERKLYTEAWAIDYDAFIKYFTDINARGKKIQDEIFLKKKDAPVHGLLGREKSESMTLDKFRVLLSDIIDSNESLRSEIEWNIASKPFKFEQGTVPEFVLTVKYNNEWFKKVPKVRQFKGTYESIAKNFNKELARLGSDSIKDDAQSGSDLKVVGDEEV
jgi:hypothetical protein